MPAASHHREVLKRFRRSKSKSSRLLEQGGNQWRQAQLISKCRSLHSNSTVPQSALIVNLLFSALLFLLCVPLRLSASLRLSRLCVCCCKIPFHLWFPSVLSCLPFSRISHISRLKIRLLLSPFSSLRSSAPLRVSAVKVFKSVHRWFLSVSSLFVYFVFFVVQPPCAALSYCAVAKSGERFYNFALDIATFSF